ncbi:hypothetical protein HGM15179_000471, partial [Zosterops borbonicus]
SADLKGTFEDVTCPPVPSFLVLSSGLPSAEIGIPRPSISVLLVSCAEVEVRISVFFR